jgi:hypothetical protein
MAKPLTREQAARKKFQAAQFMERIGQPDRADEFNRMSVDEYAEGKGLSLSNPNTNRRSNMATPQTETKTDLQNRIDDAIVTLEDAYVPESTREELAEAVSDALDTLRGEDTDEDEDDDDQDDDLD